MPLKSWLRQKTEKYVGQILEPTTRLLKWQLYRANLQIMQNDEDGILHEILRRIGIGRPAAFLKFGVGNCTECNTIILLAIGWRGIWIGGEPLAFDLPDDARLRFFRQWISKDNAAAISLNSLASLNAADPMDIRVASVDLDGNDGHIVTALLTARIRPDVFIVEYNAKFPPPIEYEMPYDESYVWVGGDYAGVSLQRWTSIFPAFDYTLVACNENGINFLSETNTWNISLTCRRAQKKTTASDMVPHISVPATRLRRRPFGILQLCRPPCH